MPSGIIVDPDAGSGSGSGSGAVRHHRRLMREVPTGSGSGVGRPAFVTTLCENPGPRRLMRDTGFVFPGFWTGGGSGSGSWVEPRPLFVFGECTTGTGPAVGSGSGLAGGIATECCPNLVLPKTLYLTLQRISGPCVLPGTGTFPMVWSDISGAWIYDLPGQNPGTSFTGIFDCLELFGPQGLTKRWRLNIDIYQGACLGFDSQLYGWDVNPASCGDPFCAAGYFVICTDATANCCTPNSRTVYLATVSESGTTCTPAGGPPPDDCPPGFGPGGSGTGTGLPFGSGTGNRQRGDRGLMRYVAPRDGRRGFVQACCPPGSGSGSGCTVNVICEPDPVPCDLVVTLTLQSGASCPELDGLILSLAHTGGNQWAATGTFVANGHPIGFTFTCFPTGWEITLTNQGTQDCATNFFSASVAGGAGFPLVVTGLVVPCCAGSQFTATFTAA